MPPAAVVALGRRALGSADHPLAQPAFRRLVIAHAVNVVGYWLYLTSVFTKVQELDGGALQISRIIALATIPLILFAPFTGLAIDRYGPKRALFLAYCAAALVLTGASFADSFAALYLAALCLAAVVALLRPAVFGLISRLVPSNQLAQANASLFAAGEAAIIAGPLLAAVLIRYAGTDVSFLTAGAALVGAALLLRRVPAVPALATDRLAGWRARITELAAGARTLAADRPSAVALACICTLFGFIGAIISLEPVLLKDELGAGRGALGIVYATAGAGSCASTAWLARRPAPPHPLPRIGIALALLGATTVGYSTSQTLLQAALWNFAVGLSFGWVLAPTVTVVQRRTPGAGDRPRHGRVRDRPAGRAGPGRARGRHHGGRRRPAADGGQRPRRRRVRCRGLAGHPRLGRAAGAARLTGGDRRPDRARRRARPPPCRRPTRAHGRRGHPKPR